MLLLILIAFQRFLWAETSWQLVPLDQSFELPADIVGHSLVVASENMRCQETLKRYLCSLCENNIRGICIPCSKLCFHRFHSREDGYCVAHVGQ
jgi:hypothetical protein